MTSIGNMQYHGEKVVQKVLASVRRRNPIRGMATYSNHPDEVSARNTVLREVRESYLKEVGSFMVLITPESIRDDFKSTKKVWDAQGILAHAQLGLCRIYGFLEDEKGAWGKAARFLRMVQERASGWYLPEIGWHPFKPLAFSSAVEGRRAAKLQSSLEKIERLNRIKASLERQLEALCWPAEKVRAHFDRAKLHFEASKVSLKTLTVTEEGPEQFASLESKAQLALGALDLSAIGGALPLQLKSLRRDWVLDPTTFAESPYESGVRALRNLHKLRKLNLRRASSAIILLENRIRAVSIQLEALNKQAFYSGGQLGLEWLTKSVALREKVANGVFADVYALETFSAKQALKVQFTTGSTRGIYTLEGCISRARKEAQHFDAPRRVGPDAFERNLLEHAYFDFRDGDLSYDEVCELEEKYAGRAQPNTEHVGSLEEREQLEAEVARWNGESSFYTSLILQIEAKILREIPFKTGEKVLSRETRLKMGIQALSKTERSELVLVLTGTNSNGAIGGGGVRSKKVRVSKATLLTLTCETRDLAQESVKLASQAVENLQQHWRNSEKEF